MNKEIEIIIAEKFPEYDMSADEETKDDFWHDLPDKDKYDINAIHLKRTANPKFNYLLCWEPGRLDENELVTDYDTFYDVDYKWWEFQKDARKESLEDFKRSVEKHPEWATVEKLQKYIDDYNDEYENGYKMYMTGDWYRLIDEHGVFLYSQFISAKWFLFYEAESILDALEEKEIPYNFRDGDLMEAFESKDPKMIFDANGREKELDSLKDMLRDYTVDIIKYIDFLVAKYSRVFSGCVFRRDVGYEPGDSFDPFTDFIFFDELSLKKVSTKNFINSFNDLKVDYKEFQIMIEEMKQTIESDFKRIYNENRSRYI